MLYDNFDRFFLFTYCSFTERLDNNNATSCIPCPEGHVALLPTSCISCNSEISGNEEDLKKFATLCQYYASGGSDTSPMEPIVMVAIIVIVAGFICLFGSILLYCKSRGICCFR